mmetsp:Transcript_2752/g.5916  ORF Transcript_2752/g.5916 Transcript_2752/m.5916 type:complete len:208 (-) Transcript_2752:254-877(-)
MSILAIVFFSCSFFRCAAAASAAACSSSASKFLYPAMVDTCRFIFWNDLVRLRLPCMIPSSPSSFFLKRLRISIDAVRPNERNPSSFAVAASAAKDCTAGTHSRSPVFLVHSTFITKLVRLLPFGTLTDTSTCPSATTKNESIESCSFLISAIGLILITSKHWENCCSVAGFSATLSGLNSSACFTICCSERIPEMPPPIVPRNFAK